MPVRTAEVIRSAALAVLEARASGIRTDAGEPIVDLVDSDAIEGERGNVISDYLRRINSISGWSTVVSDDSFKARLADAFGIGFDRTSADFVRSIGAPPDMASDVEALIFVDLDAYAQSFGRPRNQATFATSTLRLTLSSSGAYSLSRGATAKRGASSQIFYDTTETISIATPARDPATGAFYADVGVRCRTAGRIGNTVRGAINSTVGSLPGVISVSNIVPAQGGFERETNLELISALNLRLSGTNIDTLQGILNFVLQPGNGVSDAVVVGPGDPLMLRSTAGAVDVYVVGSNSVTDVAKAVVRVAGESFTLPFQPVQSISSVSDDLGASYFFDGGFSFLPDAGNAKGSSKAHAQLQWDLPSPDGVGPGVGRTITIVYSFDALIRNLQRQFDGDPQNDVPSSSILVRQATLVGVVCQMSVVPIAGIELLGFLQADVNDAVRQALVDYFDSLKLGKEADFSVAESRAQAASISNVAVVDHIDGFVMSKVGGILGFDDILAAPNESLRLDTATFLT